MSLLSRLEKRLGRHKGKLIEMTKIKEYVAGFLDDYSPQKAYKAIYALKNRGHLVGLKKDLFLVKDPDLSINEEEIIDKFYWSVLKKHCSTYVSGKRYIAGLKALELHIMNFSPPDDIIIVTDDKQSTEVALFDKKILCKKYTTRGTNLFNHFFRHTQKIKIGTHSFYIACLELAILESLYSPGVLSWGYTNTIIKKTLKKYQKTFSLEIVEAILRLGKHHTSVNRLYDIAKGVDREMAQGIFALMKKHSYMIST